MEKIGWLSLDMRGSPDILDDAKTMKKVKDESCEQIIASHILEHMQYIGRGEERVLQTINILKLWRSKLFSNGKIFISIPDADVIIDTLFKYKECYWALNDIVEKGDILGYLYGYMAESWDSHSMLYNFSCLKYCLQQAGFINIQRIFDVSQFLPEYNLAAADPRALCICAKNPE